MDAAMSSQRNAQLGPTGMPQSMRNRVMESAANIDVGRQERVPVRTPYTNANAYQERPFMNSSRSLYPQAQHSASVAGSRKGSLTSTSSAMSRFFRKGSKATDDKDFEGDDVIESGNEIFFDDLSHIRDRGRYGMNPDSSLDSTPLIPTLASRPNGPTGKMSNTQWRKQQLASRKAQINGASQQINSPRAMSFQNSPRAMSVNSRTPGVHEPRAQSMRMGEGPPLRGLGIPLNNHSTSGFSNAIPTGGPRAMSLSTPFRSSPLSRNGPPNMVDPSNPQRGPYQDRRVPQSNMPYRSPNPGLRGRSDLQQRSSYDPRANSLASVSESHLPDVAYENHTPAIQTQKHDIIGDKILKPKEIPSVPTLEPASMISKRKSVRRIDFSESENEKEEEDEEPIDFSPNKSRKDKTELRSKFPSPVKSEISSSNVSTYTAYTSQDQRNSMVEQRKSADVSTVNDISFKISGPENDVTEDSGSHRSSFETIGHPSPISAVPSLSSGDDTYPLDSQKGAQRRQSFNRGVSSLERSNSSSSIVSKSLNLMRRLSFGQKKSQSNDVLPNPELAEKRKPVLHESTSEMEVRKKEHKILVPKKMDQEVTKIAPRSRLPPLNAKVTEKIAMQPSSAEQETLDKKACNEVMTNTAAANGQVSTFVGATACNKMGFSVENWGVFQSNASLMKELRLVSMELAESIARECQLEKQLHSQGQPEDLPNSEYQQQMRQKSEEILKLTNQLNEERQKRCVAELQAHAWEKGITPSSLELGYLNSGLLTQLERERQQNAEKSARIEELQQSLPQSVSKMDQLIRENQTYVEVTIPEFKNKISLLENRNDLKLLEEKMENLRMENESLKLQLESTTNMSYEMQRNELREALNSFREKSEIEMRLVQEKVKNLESRNIKLVDQNNQLSSKLAVYFGENSTVGSPHLRMATSFENLTPRRRAES